VLGDPLQDRLGMSFAHGPQSSQGERFTSHGEHVFVYAPAMALPPSWKILNLQRSLAASHSGLGLDERQSNEVLAWLYEALVEIERSARK
jgi:hypothetical protein